MEDVRPYAPEPGPAERFLDALEAGRPKWMAEAACRGLGPGPFFPATGRSLGGDVWDDARSICRSCSVRGPCLEAGWSESDGCWGGFAPAERTRLRRHRLRESA